MQNACDEREVGNSCLVFRRCVWYKVVYRSLSVTPSDGACDVLLIILHCLTCWSCMCDGMLIEANAPPPP